MESTNQNAPQVIHVHERFGALLIVQADATALATEILSSAQPTFLDFSGVRQMSYPFAGELFGMLAKELGSKRVKRRVRLRGLLPTLRVIADTVLEELCAVHAEAERDKNESACA